MHIALAHASQGVLVPAKEPANPAQDQVEPVKAKRKGPAAFYASLSQTAKDELNLRRLKKRKRCRLAC